MRRGIISAVVGVLLLVFSACNRKTEVQNKGGEPSNNPNARQPGGPVRGGDLGPRPMAVGVRGGGAMTTTAPLEPAPPIIENEAERQEKYDAALQQAMGLFAENKYEEALTALQTAQSLRETEIVKLAIERTKQRLEREQTADTTAADIQTIIDEGRAEEAATLAADALQQFGETKSSERLAKLKKQADAILTVQVTDRAERQKRFLAEFEAAKKENNLRAAALALEQVLQGSDDEKLKLEFDELQAKLGKFDSLRAEAAELRKDPAHLEAAIGKLQEAQKLWDTIPIQQEIAEYNLALQHRRDRLAVAEFEVRGEIGIPQAGAFVADELLPAFKARYELAERGQIAQVLNSLKIPESGLVDDDAARRELGKAIKARYLVVGSITPVSGITVQARLVDTETGLIVQTAKIVAANAEELLKKLPQLGQLLQMSDDEKTAFEEQQAKEAAPVPVLKPPADEVIAPVPDVPDVDAVLPAPIIPPQFAAPVFGDLRPRQFDELPGPPAAGQLAILPVLPAARELEMRRRSLYVALELGDNLFRRRRFRDALFQYEFCLNLFPGHREIRLRVERCRLLAPPVFVPAPIVRPRLAVLDFLVVGEPVVVPPYLSWWTAEHIAYYMSPPYEIVSRAELFWWMGRLGITTRDLLLDPVARLYLGRALNVRYFLTGHLVQTASFDVTTYVVDAEFGYLASSARVHVQSVQELKLRLSELAWLTKLDPAERLRIEQDNLAWEKMLIEIRLHRQNARYQLGIELARRALKIRPNHVEVLVILRQMEDQHRLALAAESRQTELVRRRAALRDWQERQAALARAAELARLQAEQQAAARAEADQRRLAAQREQAFLSITLQARTAIQRQQFQNGILLFESALALRPNDEPTLRELALARSRAEETARANAMAAAAARERALREQRERELAVVAAKLEAERRARMEAELGQRRNQEERDRREYERLMDLAQQLSAKQKYDQAVHAAQAAKKIRATAEADRLLSQLLIELARVNAEKRGADAKAELESQLAEERQRRIEAERLADESRRKYETLLAEAQRLLKQEQFEPAIVQFTAARKIHATDITLAGLQQAQQGLQRKKDREASLARENERLKLQNELLKKHLADAQAALAEKQYERSIQLFQEAKKIDPKNETVLVGLTKAEKGREQELFVKRRQGDEALKKETFRKLLDSGKANLAAKRYDAAALSLAEALKLFPNDAEAKAAYADARAQIDADAGAMAEMQRKSAEYQSRMTDGRRAMAAKQYDKALEAFRAAQRLVPGDAAAVQFAQDALAAKSAAEKAAMEKTQQQKKAMDLANALAKVRAALAADKLDDAATALRFAAAIDPNHADVKKAADDIRLAENAKKSAEMAAKKKQDEFDTLLAKARAAVSAKRFDEAVQTASQAVQLFPSSQPARDLLTQATKARDDARRAMSAAELQANLKKLVDGANAAILAKKFDEADNLLDQAAKLSPRDADVLKAQAALRQARQAMAAGEAEAKRRQQLYDTAMTAARSALQARRFDDALKSVSGALQQMPNDKAALALRTQIDDARKSAAAMEVKREFGRLMLQARTAFAGKKYDDALNLIQEALKLMPNDVEALKLQTDIKKAKDTPPMPPMPKQPPAAYVKQMEAGAGLEAKQQYAQALTAYQAALRSLPGDDKASKKVDFCQNMADGQKALQAKKFAAAVKEFEDALKIFPNDANAKQLLQRAKMGK